MKVEVGRKEDEKVEAESKVLFEIVGETKKVEVKRKQIFE
jgi:hypothetical protein